jgi:hypothetical protein
VTRAAHQALTRKTLGVRLAEEIALTFALGDVRDDLEPGRHEQGAVDVDKNVRLVGQPAPSLAALHFLAEMPPGAAAPTQSSPLSHPDTCISTRSCGKHSSPRTASASWNGAG